VGGTKRSFGWLAFVVSLLLPGAGHAMRSRPLRASGWAAAHLFVSFATVLLASLTLSAFVWGALLLGVVYLACAVDAGRGAPALERARLGAWLVFTAALVLLCVVAPVPLAFVARRAIEAFKVPSAAMCPTLVAGDHIFADKAVYRSRAPERGDIVIYQGESADFVKRVVAVAGDEVEVRGENLILNGRAVPKTSSPSEACEGASLFEEELGTRHSIAIDRSSGGTDDFKGRVPEGKVFVLGDNRSSSHDSRHHGPIALDAVKGRVLRLWLRTENGVQKLRWEPVH